MATATASTVMPVGVMPTGVMPAAANGSKVMRRTAIGYESPSHVIGRMVPHAVSVARV